ARALRGRDSDARYESRAAGWPASSVLWPDPAPLERGHGPARLPAERRPPAASAPRPLTPRPSPPGRTDATAGFRTWSATHATGGNARGGAPPRPAPPPTATPHALLPAGSDGRGDPPPALWPA